MSGPTNNNNSGSAAAVSIPEPSFLVTPLISSIVTAGPQGKETEASRVAAMATYLVSLPDKTFQMAFDTCYGSPPGSWTPEQQRVARIGVACSAVMRNKTVMQSVRKSTEDILKRVSGKEAGKDTGAASQASNSASSSSSGPPAAVTSTEDPLPSPTTTFSLGHSINNLNLALQKFKGMLPDHMLHNLNMLESHLMPKGSLVTPTAETGTAATAGRAPVAAALPQPNVVPNPAQNGPATQVAAAPSNPARTIPNASSSSSS